MSLDCNDFVTVAKRKGNKQRKNAKQPGHPAIGQNCQIDIDDEIRKISSAKTELKESHFFQRIWTELEELKGKIDLICCLGLGKLDTLIPRHQTALLLTLRDQLQLKTHQTLVHDPIHGQQEIELLERLGVRPVKENTEGRIDVENLASILSDKEVTDNGGMVLFYLPHCPKQLTNNLLHSNWSMSRLTRIVLLANSMDQVCLRTSNAELESSAMYVKLAVDNKMVEVQDLDNDYRLEDTFNDAALHLFPENKLQQIGEEIWKIAEEKGVPVYLQGDMEYISAKGS